MDHRYSSVRIDHEYEKLVKRMNPPRVRIENADRMKHTLIQVDSANKRGCLLQVLEVLSDLNLIIKKAYIASDGGWFMDVFHVTDELGNKVNDAKIPERIKEALDRKEHGVSSSTQSTPPKHTVIELLGSDRPGLLSEVFAVLKDQKCNIVSSDAWTHNSRMAAVVHMTDETSGLAIDDEERLDNIKQLLLYIVKGSRESSTSARVVVSDGCTNPQRRLHQIMYADRDYDGGDDGVNERAKPLVTIEDCKERNYNIVTVVCPDRPKLLFDTVCTLTDMGYVMFHGTVLAEKAVAELEYYIRHMDGLPIDSELEKQRVICCLEAAIQRRDYEGIRLELCTEDRVGLLSDVTRMFRENGLSVTRAEVATRGTQAVNVFYVNDASGGCNNPETIEAVRKEIGMCAVQVKDEMQQQINGSLWLGGIFRSKSVSHKNSGLNNSPSSVRT